MKSEFYGGAPEFGTLEYFVGKFKQNLILNPRGL